MPTPPAETQRRDLLDADMERLTQQMRAVALVSMGLLFKAAYAEHREIAEALWRNFLNEQPGYNGLRLTPLSQAVREATQQRVRSATLTASHKGAMRVWVVSHACPSGQTMRKGEVPPADPARRNAPAQRA
ncbi:MAG: hypothetical protein P8171_20240 [Candidatus Thiodiazotropha sp.]